MPSLNPEGTAVSVGDVIVYTPGLAGSVEVYDAGTPGMRGAEDTRPDFLEAMRSAGVDEQLTVEITDPVELDDTGGSRAGGGGESPILLDVPGPGDGNGQFLLYVAEDGTLTWHLPDDVGHSVDDVTTRAGERRSYTIPRQVVPGESADGQRGLVGAIGRKLFKVLVFPLIDPLLGAVGDYFAGRWEEANRRNLLRTLDVPGYRSRDARALTAGDWPRLAAGPALLFVHGTASQCHSGFQRIPEDTMTALQERYEGRVLGFDHFTVSQTPTENARWLGQQLPAGAGLQVDVIAHSRGGLVSRVLCEHADEVGLAGKLAVRRLVMVATPNAGTVLADRDRLEHLLNRLTNLVQLIPDNPVTETIDIVLVVLKQLAVGAFGGLEGIMSMNPQGDYLREFLNRPGKPPPTARYFAVAAEFEPPKGSSLLRIARDGVTDVLFQRTKNDLVVPTEGVYTVSGAAGFPIAEPLVFESHLGIDHSSFWDCPDFTSRLDQWLAAATP